MRKQIHSCGKRFLSSTFCKRQNHSLVAFSIREGIQKYCRVDVPKVDACLNDPAMVGPPHFGTSIVHLADVRSC